LATFFIAASLLVVLSHLISADSLFVLLFWFISCQRTKKVSHNMLVANAIQSHQLLHHWLATVAGGHHKSLAHNNGTHNNSTDHTGINHSGQPQRCQPQWPNHKCQPQLVAITSILKLKCSLLVWPATIALSTTVSQHPCPLKLLNNSICSN